MNKEKSSTKSKTKTTELADLDFSFFKQLHFFYSSNKNTIRKSYKDLTKKFLDFNEPTQPESFLRVPQFEALEIYIFLKEFADNKHIYELFHDWYERDGAFKIRVGGTLSENQQPDLFDSVTKDQYKAVINRMKSSSRMYSNYIFALTMGTGKTLLMATCIFYEFILANKFTKDKKYCHNALIFAPDRTVLQSLKEIQSFDLSKVVPPEYVNWLTTHIQFHFLEEAGTTLSVLDRSKFNIIVSNTQKIILKKQRKDKTPLEQLFSTGKTHHKAQANAYDEISDLYLENIPEDDGELVSNQRFEKLKRLGQLGIYVDEAHHAFGEALAKDMGIKASLTSLRITIDELAAALKQSGTEVVACFNYTGTPYVGSKILPEVVYAYGLKDAIENEYLKKIDITGYKNTKDKEFVQVVIDQFISNFKDKKFEGMIPKIAFFATDIEDLQKNLKPAVEKAISKHGISLDRILVNVGDEKITTNDDIRDFNNLDTIKSNKQFILLVNKGREGWNCRSLSSVALHRKPKSKIFVLQASMRCLRAIGATQETGYIYLSEENLEILDSELRQNFRITTEELKEAGKTKKNEIIRLLPPPVKITIKRVNRTYFLKEKTIEDGIDFEFENIDRNAYRIVSRNRKGVESDRSSIEISDDITVKYREKTDYSELTLVAEISRYLNKSPLKIEDILNSSKQKIDEILKQVNEFNENLYDRIIPYLFKALYDLEPIESTEEFNIELVKNPPQVPGYYEMMADPNLTVRKSEAEVEKLDDKSFHLDTYCFDSLPEKVLFWDLLREKRVKNVWFTGMLTHGQSDFFIQYIDPESHSVRSYYPDFLYVDTEGIYNIVEVKGDNMINDPVVLAKKEYAEQLATASKMTYKMITGSDAKRHNYRKFFE